MTPEDIAAVTSLVKEPTSPPAPREAKAPAGMADWLDPLYWPYPLFQNEIVCHVEWDREPVSKQRARMGRGGRWYTPKETKSFEETLGLLLKWQKRGNDMTGAFGIRCIFARTNAQRLDADNCLKAVCDSANGVIWKDDSQVQEMHVRLFKKADKPRIDVVIYRIPDGNGLLECEQCGKAYHRPRSQSEGRRYCSQACQREAERKSHITFNCVACGRIVEKPRSVLYKADGRSSRGQFCSRKCRAIELGKRRTAKYGPPTWKCRICGGSVSRKEYTRCMVCFLEGRVTA